LARAAVELRALRVYALTLLWWMLSLLIVLLAGSTLLAGALILMLYGLPVVAMTLRHRSIVLGLYSVATWQLYTFGLVRGAVRKRTSPIDRVDSVVLRTVAGVGEPERFQSTVPQRL
jgi:hypothetical protein